MNTGSHQPTTRLIVRLGALLEALRDGPLEFGDLVARLGAAYPPGASARRMLDRDLKHLAALGIIIERQGSPRRYALRGGLPIFSAEELRVLALIRDTFDARHPQATRVSALLTRLTAGLNDRERRDYERRAARRSPVRPAIPIPTGGRGAVATPCPNRPRSCRPSSSAATRRRSDRVRCVRSLPTG